MEIDPFYGATDLLVVLANKDIPTYIYDKSLMMSSMMNALICIPVHPNLPGKLRSLIL